MEETNNFFQTLWKSETRVKWEHTVPAFIPSAFWPVHWATGTRTLLTFLNSLRCIIPCVGKFSSLLPWKQLARLQVPMNKAYSIPSRTWLYVSVICRQTLQWLVIIKTVIWRSGCLLNWGYRNYSFQQSSSESASNLQMAFPDGRPPPWFPQCGSSQHEQAILMCRPTSTFNNRYSK